MPVSWPASASTGSSWFQNNPMTYHDPPPVSSDERILRWFTKHPLVGIVLISSVLLTVYLFNWGSRNDQPRVETTASTEPATSLVELSIAPTEVIAPTAMPSADYTFNPLPTVSPAPVLTRLLFTGDINPGRCPAQAARLADNYLFPYQYVADTLSAADITVGSLDGTISDLVTSTPCEISYNLVGPSRTVNGLVYAGFDVISVATNHALDCGNLGWRCDGKIMDDTRHNLLAVNIQPVGDGDSLLLAEAPVIIERNGVRFAFLGVNAISGDATWATDTQPGTAPLSDDTIDQVTRNIQAARAMADVVIVMPHWGVEYTDMPDASQRTWAAQMIAAGADLVIGNHPHVIQPVESLPGGVVAYALGNFVFDQAPIDTNESVVFEADFLGRRLVNWQLLPVRINNKFQPVWASPLEAASILQRITQAALDLNVR